MTSVRDAIQKAAQTIAARDAQLLLSHALGTDRAWLIAHKDDALPAAQDAAFWQLVRRRSSGEPIQYIIGVQEFFGLALEVGPGVLIPRPETEHLVQAVLDWAQTSSLQSMHIVDVGTGSGAIALALAKNLPHCQVTGTEISVEALAIARRNALQLGLVGRVRFVQADLLEFANCLEVDVVVSNPPYIPLGDAPGMQTEVVAHEPHSALFAGNDGLDVYRRLIPKAFARLRQHGLLAMEIGWRQRASLEHLLTDWQDVRFLNDYAGIPRVALALRK